MPPVQRVELPASLLERFAVVDLEVSDPPVEELIGGLFRQRDSNAEASQ